MFKTVWNLIKYWYFRYLLVTELYMVEKWERVMIHIAFAIIFTLLALFNAYAVLGLIDFIFAPILSDGSLKGAEAMPSIAAGISSVAQ